ncbi:MAG: nitroreductase family protein [Terasakiella sp.]|uniref:nitroreductase family protein n=1 Tax=unclassified Terasakiella TaxID=2614952 RepID=UPI003AFF7083
MTSPRHSHHPIHPAFLQRWSPRSFDAQAELPENDLLTILDAARWAPSAYNIQPWRFTYSMRNDSHWANYLDLLDPFNAGWAKNASALVFLASDSLVEGQNGETPRPSHYHHFDSGAAWAQLALQATIMGYSAHAMAGIFKDKAAAYLGFPERYQVQIAVALGKNDHPDKLSEDLRLREQPSDRFTLDEIAFRGAFQHE